MIPSLRHRGALTKSLAVCAVPGIVLGIGLAAMLTWWRIRQRDVRESEARRFADIAGRIAAQVDEGILVCEQIVVGIAAIAGIDTQRSRSIDWGEYITRISREIVAQHGGRIWAANNKAAGADFVVGAAARVR
jgi:hypothetical protein